MAKPRLEKVRALFYVLQHIQEGASNFDTPSNPDGRATPPPLPVHHQADSCGEAAAEQPPPFFSSPA